MLSSMLFVRRSLVIALPSFALFAAACSDEDALDPAGGNAGTAGRAGATATAGTAGRAGAAGGSSDAAGAAGAAGASGSAGANAEAGTGGETDSQDLIAPQVSSSWPPKNAIEVSSRTLIRVTFSEAMDPATLTSESIRVTLANVAVPGKISYVQETATFTPDSPLALNSVYKIAVSVAASDLAGNALAAAYASSFTTSALAALGPAPVNLGTAANYAILAQAGISNVPTSVITGNLGVSPVAASSITGFALTRAGTHWTSPQVVGNIFAADNDPPTPSNLTTAVANMQAAYTDAAGRPTPDFTNLGAGVVAGLTLTPGLYKWASSVTIPTDVTIAGAANDVWIFQISGDLALSAAKGMILSGGAQPKNIYWQVAGSVDLGTTSHAEGNVLCKTAITLGTGASLNGRLLAQTAVSIASSTITQPAP